MTTCPGKFTASCVTRTFLCMASLQPALQLLSVLLKLLHLDLELLTPRPPLLLLLLQLLRHNWKRQECKCQGQEMKSWRRKREANWVLSKRVGHLNIFQMFCVEMEASRRANADPRETFLFVKPKFQATDTCIARYHGNVLETTDFFVAKGDNLARSLSRLQQYHFVLRK